MPTPRLEFDLQKIIHNINTLKNHYAKRSINIMGVTKAIGGNTDIANAYIKCGINILADSRIQNIKKMVENGVKANFLLLRSPLLSELDDVIDYCEISHNTEYVIIQRLSELALKKGVVHKIILMVELGDLREGVLPSELHLLIPKVLKLKGVKIVGLGTNLACFSGVQPNDQNMGELSSLVTEVESTYGLQLTYISGGNSANYGWSKITENVQRINYLRLGESIYLGCDPLTRKPIPGLYTDAFTMVAEVIESGVKSSFPTGKTFQNAFANLPEFVNKGPVNRAILGIGKQDVDIAGLKSRLFFNTIGYSSDHLVIDTKKQKLKIGQELTYDLNYSSLLSAMTSRYVSKKTMNNMNTEEYCEMVEQKDIDLKLLLPEININENDSPLVSLKDTNFNLIFEPSVKKDYQYLVREEIVEKIGKISQSLEHIDKRLIIRSVWRSFDHQKMVWDNKVNFLKEEHPEKSTEEIISLVNHFIAPHDKSMHSTGGAVDALIYDLKTNKVLDFGTNKGLDIDLSTQCFPFHPEITITAVKNRKLLIDLFQNEHFYCDNKEYWHFDYGNAVWAAKKGEKSAFYGVIKRLGE